MSKIKKWSKEEVFKKLQHLSLTYDVISYNQYLSLIKRTEYPHIHIIKNYFGSIKKGFELVGIEYVEYTGKKLLIEMQKMNIKYKKQDIIGGLQLIYKKYGEIKPIDLPKYLKQENLFGKDIIGKHFGTIEAAYKNAFETDSNISESVSQATLTSLYNFKDILLYMNLGRNQHCQLD